jgi:hypothetical protein
MNSQENRNIPLSRFMKANRAKDGDLITHTGIFEPTGTFFISRNKIEEFYKIYNHKIRNGITETPQTYCMLVFDFDICKPADDYKDAINESNGKFYANDEVKFIINTINNRLRKVIKDCKDDNLMCCLLEKDIYQDLKNPDRVKGGFHLQYVNLFIEKSKIMDNIINPIKEHILNETSLEFDNVYNNQWLMYGASKGEHYEPYILTKIYNVAMEEMTVSNAFENYDLFDTSEDKIQITPENVESLLPRILSINPMARECKEIIVLNDVKPKEIVKHKKKINDDRDIEEKLAECRKLLPLLSEDRVDSYEDWMKLGWCLYSIGNGCDEARDLWDEKSQESSKYDAGCCDEKWNTMKVRDYTIGTLKFWAKQDSPEVYKELYKKKGSYEDEIIFNNEIDIDKDDNYYWVDFERKYMNTIFNSYNDLKQNVIKDLPRVLAKITFGKGYYVKKEHSDCLCAIIKMKDMKRIVFKYEDSIKNKKGQILTETINIPLDTLYNECRLPLYSHPDIIVDKDEKSNAYNIFKGIKASKTENIDNDLINQFFHHIKSIICNDNEECSHFFISWLRWIMIRPHIKSKIFVFLYSLEGYGKSTIGKFLSNFVFGDSASLTVAGLENVIGSFNNHLLGKLFCQVEELPATSETFHTQFNKMKHYIVDDKLFCIPKGVDGFKANNYLNFLGCSNNKYSLRMPKDDTRYFVLEIVKKMSSDYWTDYYKKFQNQEFANMLYSYFLKTSDDEYVEFYGRPKIPMTELKEELIDFSLPSYDRFYKDIMEGEYKLDNSIIKKSFIYMKKEYKYATSFQELYSAYLDWGSLNGERDLKRKYLEFKQHKNDKFRFIDLEEKIKNINNESFREKSRFS